MLGGSRMNATNTNDQSSSVDAFMLLDRFVSASTASDVLTSLRGLEKGLKHDFASVSETMLDYEDHIPLKHLWKILHREHDKLQDDDDQAAEGVLEACRILTHFLTKHSKTENNGTHSQAQTTSFSSNTQQALLAKRLLGEPAPGRILEALLDVVVAQDDAINNQGHVTEDGETIPPTTATAPLTPYVRVLACQALHKLGTLQPQLAQPQLLRAPNGLHRLVGLLGPEIDEQVRNETLLLAATLAQWPAVAQVWIFAGLPDTLLELATQGEDAGLTRGPVLTQDALAIFDNLVTHIANPNMAELLLTGNSSQPQLLGQRMCQLLDLRQGQYFVHPETNTAIQTTTSKNNKKANDDDDLDDLIKSASSSKQKSSSQQSEEEAREAVVVPRLLASEEVILKIILNIWSTLLHEQPKVQDVAWKQHGMVIRMIWEMALLSPPPTPYTPYQCGVPSVALQQAALHAVAQSMVFCFDDIVGARDRLLYMVCTGGLGQTLEDKHAISQAALYVLRQAAPSVFTTEMILFALSPPPSTDEAVDAPEQPSPSENAMVVPKLLSTVQQHLITPSHPDTSKSGLEMDRALQTVGLVGSVGALSLFLKDDVSRSMLLKLVVHQQESNVDIPTDGPTFVDNLLDRIEKEMDEEVLNVGIIACLLRFLAIWCSKAPEVVYAVLQSPKATILSTLFSNSKKHKLIGQAAGLVLGVCLADLRDEDQASGWTRDTLVQLLSRKQQSFQQRNVDVDEISEMPWSHSEFELKVYREWKRSTLLTVRQAVVQFLTSGSEQGDDEDEDGDDSHHDDKSTTSSSKALSKVMAQQTAELESLRQELATAKKDIEDKTKKLAIYKMRVESTPTELDELVAETTEQNHKLQHEMDQMQQIAQATKIEMASVHENLKAVQNERDEARNEVSTLQQDIESLTQAYSSMETEVSRQQEEVQRLTQAAQHKSETSATEPSSESGDTSSTQVATLRAENARFREDAQAKDNWMQMAVERFKVLDQEKLAMQQQIQSLSESSNSADILEKLKGEHTRALEELEKNHTSEVNGMKSQLQQEVSLKDSLQSEVESLKQELEVSRYAADGAKKESEERLADLQRKLEKPSTYDFDNPEHLRAREELSKAKEEYEELLAAKDKKIHEIESMLQQLQSRQESEPNAVDREAIRAKDEEIAQLRQSNDAAQEWMSKAVEHHNLLSEQVANLTAEKERVESELAELTTKVLPLEASAKLANEVQRELDEKTAQLEELSAKQTSQIEELKTAHQQALEQMQAQVDIAKKESEDLQLHFSTHHADKSDELQRVKAELIEKTEQINTLLQEHDELKVANERLFDLDMEVVELRAELKDAFEEKEAIEAKIREDGLSSRESEEVLTIRIKSLQDENTDLHQALKESTQEKEVELHEVEGRWRSQCEVLQTRIQELEEKNNSTTDSLDNDTKSQSAGEARSEKESDTVEELNAQIASLREEMDAQEKEAANVIAQWQESYTNIQTQYTKMKQELDGANDGMSRTGEAHPRIMELEKALEEKDREANDVISQWQTQYAELQRRLDDFEDEKSVHGSSQKISDLHMALEEREKEANDVIAQWQESYATLQKENSELRARTEIQSSSESVSEIQKKTAALEQELAEYKATSGGFWEEIDSLKSQVKKLEGDLEQAHHDLSENDNRLRILVTEKEAAESQLSTMSKEYNDLLDKEDDQNRKIGSLQSKISDLESQILVSQVSAQESADRISELENKLSSKEEDLMADEKEADEVIQQWQDSHEELSKENAALSERIETLSAQYDNARAENERLLSQVAVLESSVGTLEREKIDLATQRKRISELESVLENKAAEIENLQSDLDSSRLQLQDLSEKLQEAKFKNDDDAATIEKLEDALEQGRPGSEELEATKAQLAALEKDLRDTEEQFAADSEEADEVINQWKESYESLEAEKTELEERLAELEGSLTAALGSRDEYAGIAEQLQSDLDSLRNSTNTEESSHMEDSRVLQDELARLKNDIAEKEKSLSEQVEAAGRLAMLEGDLAVANDSIATLTNRIQNLTDDLAAKETQLAEETENADDVIGEWESSYNTLLEEKSDLESQLSSLQKEMLEVQEKYSESISQVRSLQASVEENMSFKTSLDGLEAEREALKDKVAALELSLKDREEEKATLTSQIASLQQDFESQRLDDERSLAEASHLSEHLEGQIKDLSHQVQHHREEIESLASQRDELRERVSTDQRELNQLNARVKAYEKKLELHDELQVQFGAITKEHVELKNKNSNVDALVRERDEWRSRFNQAESHSNDITSDLEEARTKANEIESDLRSQVLQLEEQLRSSNSLLENYTSKISELETELNAEIQQADEAIQEWHSSYQALQDEKVALEAKLSLNTEQTLGSEHIVPPPPPPPNSTEIPESVINLQTQLRDTQAARDELNEEYVALMNSFESTVNLYDELESKNNELEKKYGEALKDIARKDCMLGELQARHGNERANLQEDNRFIPISESDGLSPPPVSIIQTELEAEREARKAADDRCRELELNIEAQRVESDRLIKSWKGEAEEMGRLLMKTNAEMESNRRQSETAIDSLKARFTEMEDQKMPLEAGGEDEAEVAPIAESKVSRKKFDKEVANRKLAEEKATLAEQRLFEIEKEAISARKRLQETEEALTSRLESAIAEQEREKIDREAQRTLENDRFMNLERDFESLRRDYAALEQDRDVLKASLVELEADLQDANNDLQLHLTNEISEQATKLAAEALRRQVDEMRQQAEVDTSSFNAERTARLAAEQEAKRLQSDLAALLGLENTERNQNEIRRRTAEATDYFQRTEKKEIKEMESALEDMKEKLNRARSHLREAEERADSASLQSNQLEQDLSVAKSDLKIVSHMIEEMRDSESSRRTSMEHRISSLEDEKNVMRRHHQAEIENMRTELEQISLHRDRLAQALQESEKSKDALLQASKSGRGISSENPSDELVRLRMEKAHLLAAASKEASRTERRIRELREAAMSSADADLLVERELRAAAELALANATSELQSARVNSHSMAIDSQEQSKIYDLEAEVKKLHSQISSLLSEKNELSENIAEIRSSSKQAIERLKEECKLAKAKALQSERAGRHDAEFRAEVARLQDSSSVDGHTSVDDSSTFGEFKHDTQISNLYDLVDQQRQTIEEQRDAHSAMETDFEGLLALLAQSKLVEECLSSSLARSGGEKAVRDAIIDAEERAVAQYGTFVRVSE